LNFQRAFSFKPRGNIKFACINYNLPNVKIYIFILI
jgi:hypothetical protein